VKGWIRQYTSIVREKGKGKRRQTTDSSQKNAFRERSQLRKRCGSGKSRKGVRERGVDLFQYPTLFKNDSAKPYALMEGSLVRGKRKSMASCDAKERNAVL